MEINREPIIQSDEDDCEPIASDSATNTEQHNDETSQRRAKRRQETLTSVDKKAGKNKVRKEKDVVDIAVIQYISDKMANKTTSDGRQMFHLSFSRC
ncbi:hypothetical protein JTB14_032545 [Gonioctena quinquepunctata]|nr:hypothetical protein JTB14_032545 [Gonioctena quinquepunctata]